MKTHLVFPGFFLLISLITNGQNVLMLNSVSSHPGDTVEITASIDNHQEFISFQFDIRLPGGVQFLPNSVHLGERSTNHVVVANLTDPDRLRIISYSPDNSPFNGTSGKIMAFRLIIGTTRGVFPLHPESAVIGDPQSGNILTGTGDGLLSVYPLSAEEKENPDALISARVFPNPFSGSVNLEVVLKTAADMEFSLYSDEGQLIGKGEMGRFSPGVNRVTLPGSATRDLTGGNLYHLVISANNHGIKQNKVCVSVIKK
jgi:hypothetical protein